MKSEDVSKKKAITAEDWDNVPSAQWRKIVVKDEELMVKEIQASTIVLPKNKTSVAIVNDWNHIAQNNFDTITDIYNNEDNGDGFIRNQHDQSLLSLILIKYKIPSINGIESWTSGDWNTLNHMPFLDTRKRYN